MIDNAMHRLWGFGFGLVLDKITMNTQKSSYLIRPMSSSFGLHSIRSLNLFIEIDIGYSSISSSDLEVLS